MCVFGTLRWMKDSNTKLTAKVTHNAVMTRRLVPSYLISQPRLIFGRMLGSALIRSRVCIMASTLWIPYCSRTAPHFRSWTWTKDTRQNGLDAVYLRYEKTLQCAQ